MATRRTRAQEARQRASNKRSYQRHRKKRIRQATLYYQQHRTEVNAKRRARWAKNKARYNKRRMARYHKNRARELQKRRVYWAKNKARLNKRQAEYRRRDSEKWRRYRAEYIKLWHKRNPNYRKDYNRNRWNTDPLFRLTTRLRRRLRKALKYKGVRKSAPTLVLLGCSPVEFQKHIQGRWKKGMTWENMKLWHLDHIKPVEAFDKTDPNWQYECFHYTNIQPLWAKDNLKKGDSYELPKS